MISLDVWDRVYLQDSFEQYDRSHKVEFTVEEIKEKVEELKKSLNPNMTAKIINGIARSIWQMFITPNFIRNLIITLVGVEAKRFINASNSKDYRPLSIQLFSVYAFVYCGSFPFSLMMTRDLILIILEDSDRKLPLARLNNDDFVKYLTDNRIMPSLEDLPRLWGLYWNFHYTLSKFSK